MKVRTDTEIISQYIERSPTKRTLRQLHKELLERQRDYAIWKKAPTLIPNVSSVHVTRNGGIHKLGVSHPKDMFTDNFGRYVAMQFGITNFFFTDAKDESNISRSVRLQLVGGGTSIYTLADGGDTYTRLGSGSTLVARSNYNVETALTTAPENAAVINTANPGYANGVVTWVTSIGPFGASETVREGAVFSVWGTGSTNTNLKYCTMRFNYTPTLVLAAETAVVTTTVNI